MSDAEKPNASSSLTEEVTFSWKFISRSIFVKAPKSSKVSSSPPSSSQNISGKEEKHLLQNVSGLVRPGEVLAVMGPSGAGKSSFLDTISGRVPASSGGSVALDNHVLNSAGALRGLSAYVPQDDALLGTLTVAETIAFSAEIRLPHAEYTDEDRLKHVNDIIRGLGLERVRDSPIGTVLVRGISGGQRRRVSIGMELVTHPAILFLDEPTSGLDSAASFFVIKMVKELAQKEKFSVIATIHQPSNKTYELFDKVMLLAKGQTVYFGPRDRLTEHFESLGFPCPQFANPADYYMDLINTDFVDENPAEPDNDEENKLTEPIASAETLERLITGYEKSPLNECMLNEINIVRTAKSDKQNVQLLRLQSQCKMSYDRARAEARKRSCASSDCPSKEKVTETEETLSVQIEDVDESVDMKRLLNNLYNNNVFVETNILLRRAFVNATRNVLMFWIRVILYAMLALLMGAAWWQVGTSQDAIQDRMGAHFFGMTFLSFMAVAAVPAVVEERMLFDRERANGAYRTVSYVLANTNSLSSFRVPNCLCFLMHWLLDGRVS